MGPPKTFSYTRLLYATALWDGLRLGVMGKTGQVLFQGWHDVEISCLPQGVDASNMVPGSVPIKSLTTPESHTSAPSYSPCPTSFPINQVV